MYRIKLTLEACAPLSIGRRKPGGSVSETESYIPGTVIRGAIAGQLLRLARQLPGQNAQTLSDDLSDNDDDFSRLFLGEQPAIFQNAYPAIATDKKQAKVLTEPVQVLPATVLSSKNKSGFRPKANGVFDTLVDRFCAEQVGHLYDPSCPTEAGERVEPFGGLYCYQDSHYYQPSISTRLLTKVGINRRRATAQDSLLYSIQVLNETQGTTHGKPQPACYTSQIIVNSSRELAQDLVQFLNGRIIRLGGSASRGLGKVKFTARLAEDGTNVSYHHSSDLETRIDSFNEALEARWREWRTLFDAASDVDAASDEALKKRTFFTLDLQSDGIYTDRWQRTTVISPAMLQDFASVQDSLLQIHSAYSSYSSVSGWNAAWGLMKDVELATNKGAVYLFSTEDKALWLNALSRLELTGTGDRTAEGFGQVCICNQFHTIFRENAV